MFSSDSGSSAAQNCDEATCWINSSNCRARTAVRDCSGAHRCWDCWCEWLITNSLCETATRVKVSGAVICCRATWRREVHTHCIAAPILTELDANGVARRSSESDISTLSYNRVNAAVIDHGVARSKARSGCCTNPQMTCIVRCCAEVVRTRSRAAECSQPLPAVVVGIAREILNLC